MALYGTNVPPFQDPEIPIERLWVSDSIRPYDPMTSMD